MPEMYTLREWINATLDKNYTTATRGMFEQIAALCQGSGSAMQKALTELDEEVNRLQESGLPLKPDNAVLLKVLSVNEDQLKATQNLIEANAAGIEASGQVIASDAVAAKLFMAVTASLIAAGINPVGPEGKKRMKAALAAQGLSYVYPTALAFATQYVESAAWIARMNNWGAGYAELIHDVVLRGIQEGWSPIRTARELRRLAENIPISAAENITRTLQLTSYRDASLAAEIANGEYIEKKIRIAKLDERTCMACIALHGTEMKVGERVTDHYRGRCDSILIPIGGSMPDTMQSDSKPGERNFVPWQTGEEWFASLPPGRQAMQSSFLKNPAMLRAYRDGIPLSAFVGEYEDDIFGTQTVQRSLIGALGDDAEQYYSSNNTE